MSAAFDKEGLASLLERVKSAAGPDREIDASIAGLLLGQEVKREPNRRNWRMGHKKTKTRAAEPWVALPAYTASIDASLALVERLLRGWEYVLEGVKRPCCVLLHPDNEEGEGVFVETAPTLPLAILVAILRALEASNGEADGKPS